MSLFGNRMKKYFGEDNSTWWCRFAKCLYIFSSAEMKDLDSNGEVSWAKPSEKDDTIIPICPHHGTLLHHGESDRITIPGVVEQIM